MIFIIAGLFGGFLAGFLGLGGGILVVPTMLFMGFTMKFAIGISITQMVFSSIIGTISNIKKQKHLLKKGLLLGIGGSLGGLFSGVIVNFTPTYILEYSFLGFILLAIISVYKNKQTEISPKDKQ
ncbi:MAG: Probable membrane transporter protein, partial [uncultured Campylobacterales bacterium]